MNIQITIQYFFVLHRPFNNMYLLLAHTLRKTPTTAIAPKWFSSQPNNRDILHVLKTYAQELEQSHIMEKMIPRKYTEDNLASLTYNQRFTQQNNHLNSLNYALGEPIWDLLDRGGKRWRPVLAMLIAELYGRQRSEVFQLAALTEIVHNGSLIIDDIEDDSSVRRDKECVHKLYGLDISINAGNFMYFAPMLTLFKNPSYSAEVMNEFVKIYLEETVQLHIGQAWDIAWHNSDKLKGEYPTENHYLQMTAQKTGVLARLAARMTCAYVRASPQQEKVLKEFVENLGVAFQIQDDIINLESEEMIKTKGYNGEDIHEGKITLMVINHLKSATPQAKERLLAILKMKTLDPVLIREAIDLLAASKSISYAKSRMQELVEEANSNLDKHFPSSEARELLKSLAFLGIKRKH